MKTLKKNRDILISVGNMHVSTKIINSRLIKEKILNSGGISTEYQIGKNDTHIILIDRDMYESRNGRKIIATYSDISEWLPTDSAFAKAYLMSFRK